MTDPRPAYESRLSDRKREAAEDARLDRAISYARLAVFFAGALLGWIAPRSVPLAAALFLGLVLWHARVLRAKARAERGVDFYRKGLERIDDRWPGTGETGDRFRDERHLYAQDLDLFGKGSLYELLGTVRTRAGQETLARWLLQPAAPGEIRARQEAVGELAPSLDLREALATADEDVASELHPDALAAWGSAPRVLAARWPRVVAPALAAFSVGGLLLFWAGRVQTLPVYLALAGALVFGMSLRRRVLRVIEAVERPARELLLLSGVLALVERPTFGAPRLVEIQSRLRGEGEPPSVSVARLRRLVDLLDARRNPFFAPVGVLLLWSTQLAHAIEAWRAEHGRRIEGWLRALGDFEALLAFSGFAGEHPDDRFPEIVEGSPCFRAVEIGHPLLPRARLVRNDLILDRELPLLIVSGSNMSGKSTLLRTVGINAVLALAGAPVRARRLELSPFAVGASIRTQDSLQDGVSRFYAEITRVRQIVDLLDGPLTPLFLLDELLQGTNSHDRRIGAEAVVRGLVERGALGLITTHDLALAQIAEALSHRASNVHFEDQIEDGKIRFDYRLRPGVVQKSNALELMRAVGLPVPPSPRFQ